MSDRGNFFLTPRQGTYLMGIANFSGAAFAALLVERYNRKFLMLTGHALMTVALFLIALFQVYELGIEVVLMMMIYLIFFQCTEGPICWLYTSEVVADAALGICVLSLMVFCFLVSLLTPAAIELLTTEGVFFVLSVFCALGGVFYLIYMKETKGLSDN